MDGRDKKLKKRLDGLYNTFDRAFLSTDPLEFVHRFDSKGDREVVGLVASSLAYGRVSGIRRSIERVLEVMGTRPFEFTMNFRPSRDGRLFSDFRHRFNTGRDITCLIYFARQMIEESGSVGAFFMRGYRSGDRNIRAALEAFSEGALALSTGGVYAARRLPEKAGVRFFFPSPRGGSACKRLNLYLRWMVRRDDGLDFGLWKEIKPSQLVIPLDTHIARISRNLGLTTRKSADWKTAEEITASLARLDPEDPVRYDFSLCRLGILERCPHRVDRALCARCMIKDVCVL